MLIRSKLLVCEDVGSSLHTLGLKVVDQRNCFFDLKEPEKRLRILFENRSLSENVRLCQPCYTSIQFHFTRCFHSTLKTWTSKDVIVRAAVRNRCWILVEGGPNGTGSQDWAQLKEHGALGVG